MTRQGRCFVGFAAALWLVPACYGYIRLSILYGDGSTVYIKRADAAGIQFYVNSQIAAGLQSGASGSAVTVISPGSNPVAAIRSALATWNGVSIANARFLALKTTAKVNDPTDNSMTIAVGATLADLSALGAAVAITVNTGAGFTVGSSPTGDVTDSDIVLNPAIKFSTDGSTAVDLQAVMTHELGHALGLDHSGLLGAVMFQYTELNQRYLSADEISFAGAVYPAGAGVLGTIHGKLVAADGSAVQSGLVTLHDMASGNALSALTGADGTYTVQAPAGSYIVYAEPMTPGSVVQPGNLYLPSSTVVTTNFQTSMLGGMSSPTAVTVAAGDTATAANLAVTPGSSSLTPPSAGIGKTGGAGDIRSALAAAPFVIASGQSIDVGLTGGGIDGTVSIQVFGQGVSVRAGSVHVDPGVLFNGQPLVRATLDVTARQTPSLADLMITKGSSTLAMSGVLVIVPPTPAFTLDGIVSAASYKGGGVGNAVSPGGIYSIYSAPAGSLGPNPLVQPAGYDIYGNLATTLGGVTVTFDGIPAPLYLSYAAQLNLQVPFEIAGNTSTKVVVNFNGSQSAPVIVPVTPTQPAFFTVTALGMDVVVQNFPDYSLNRASNPSPRGGTILIYGTGIGKLSYQLATGQPGVVPPSGYASTYSCSFGGWTADAYAYWNYGFVGEALWTATVPNGTPSGAVTMTCTDSVTGASTQSGTIYVK